VHAKHDADEDAPKTMRVDYRVGFNQYVLGDMPEAVTQTGPFDPADIPFSSEQRVRQGYDPAHEPTEPAEDPQEHP
jgi:hypothetical protein